MNISPNIHNVTTSPIIVKKLRKLGFEPPETGGRHHYMRYGSYTLTLPTNKDYSIPQIKMLLKEIKQGINKEIPLDEWERL